MPNLRPRWIINKRLIIATGTVTDPPPSPLQNRHREVARGRHSTEKEMHVLFLTLGLFDLLKQGVGVASRYRSLPKWANRPLLTRTNVQARKHQKVTGGSSSPDVQWEQQATIQTEQQPGVLTGETRRCFAALCVSPAKVNKTLKIEPDRPHSLGATSFVASRLSLPRLLAVRSAPWASPRSKMSTLRSG